MKRSLTSSNKNQNNQNKSQNHQSENYQNRPSLPYHPHSAPNLRLSQHTTVSSSTSQSSRHQQGSRTSSTLSNHHLSIKDAVNNVGLTPETSSSIKPYRSSSSSTHNQRSSLTVQSTASSSTNHFPSTTASSNPQNFQSIRPIEPSIDYSEVFEDIRNPPPIFTTPSYPPPTNHPPAAHPSDLSFGLGGRPNSPPPPYHHPSKQDHSLNQTCEEWDLRLSLEDRVLVWKLLRQSREECFQSCQTDLSQPQFWVPIRLVLEPSPPSSPSQTNLLKPNRSSPTVTHADRNSTKNQSDLSASSQADFTLRSPSNLTKRVQSLDRSETTPMSLLLPALKSPSSSDSRKTIQTSSICHDSSQQISPSAATVPVFKNLLKPTIPPRKPLPPVPQRFVSVPSVRAPSLKGKEVDRGVGLAEQDTWNLSPVESPSQASSSQIKTRRRPPPPTPQPPPPPSLPNSSSITESSNSEIFSNRRPPPPPPPPKPITLKIPTPLPASQAEVNTMLRRGFSLRSKPPPPPPPRNRNALRDRPRSIVERNELKIEAQAFKRRSLPLRGVLSHKDVDRSNWLNVPESISESGREEVVDDQLTENGRRYEDVGEVTRTDSKGGVQSTEGRSQPSSNSTTTNSDERSSCRRAVEEDQITEGRSQPSSNMATSSDDQSSSGRAAEERDGYSRFTELDLLLLRLERSLGNGDDYEDVRLLNELIGPANAHRLNVSDLSSNCNNSYSNDSRSGECREKVLRRLIEEEDEGSERMVDREGLNLRIGTVEEIYRRIDKDGRVKKKMSLLGVRCNKCIICLSQFKSQQRSILLNCSHVFHKKCILNWFIRDEENQRLAGIRTIQQPRTTSAGSGTSRGSEGFYCCPVCKKVEVLFK